MSVFQFCSLFSPFCLVFLGLFSCHCYLLASCPGPSQTSFLMTREWRNRLPLASSSPQQRKTSMDPHFFPLKPICLISEIGGQGGFGSQQDPDITTQDT